MKSYIASEDRARQLERAYRDVLHYLGGNRDAWLRCQSDEERSRRRQIDTENYERARHFHDAVLPERFAAQDAAVAAWAAHVEWLGPYTDTEGNAFV